METEYSKRVYQGVRVKHTVKDLLAEKRSRQTGVPHFPGISAPQSPFVPMTGSHALPGYYSMRRPFISEAEFSTSSKQLSTDVHSSALTGKSVSCDPVPIQYQSLLDGYYTESFSDYCGAGLAGGGSTIFSSSTLSTLLPSLPADTSNFVLRDSWETAATEVMEGLCADSLVPAPLMGSLSGSELHSPGQYRASSKGSVVPSSLFYPLHPLEDGHYPSPFQPAPGGFVYPTYTAVSGQSTTKTAALSSAETENPPLLSDTFPWVREDTSSGPWSQYEIRRAF